MKNRYICIVALLTIGHLLSELHALIYWFWPASVDYYVDSWFVTPPSKVNNITILWYSKMLEDSLILVAILFAGAAQAYTHNYKSYMEWRRYSSRLYVLWVLYFLFHCFDAVSFLYNYKTSRGVYAVVLLSFTASALFVGFYRVKIFLKD